MNYSSRVVSCSAIFGGNLHMVIFKYDYVCICMKPSQAA